ncbi:MAG TPA: hypothetical protein VMX75_09265 [Spirochaetia bacterium]|nr:hypothetical protein [Spirochaetia bacterium]
MKAIIESCSSKNYQSLMMTQLQVYRKHIDTHLKFHPHVKDLVNPMVHFFNMFGIFFRQIYCGFACPERQICAVRLEPKFKIKHVFSFNELRELPIDLTIGVSNEGCHRYQELNAVQLYIARNPDHIEKHKYYYGICGDNEEERTVRHFLSMYAPLLCDMFCSAVCPDQAGCEQARKNFSQQSA